MDAVVTALSMFRLFCEEEEIRCGQDELPIDYHIHAELASACNIQTVGNDHVEVDRLHNFERFS